MGALLVLTGVAFLTGSVNEASVWLLKRFGAGQNRMKNPPGEGGFQCKSFRSASAGWLGMLPFFKRRTHNRAW
jgi:hypothetical protein